MNGWFRNLQGDFETHKYRVDIIFLFILCLDILSFENKKISSKKETIERPFHAAAAQGVFFTDIQYDIIPDYICLSFQKCNKIEI